MITVGRSNDSAILRKGGPYYTKRIDKDDFYNLYLNLTMEEVVAVAHRPQDMIKHCQFARVPMYSPYCNELIDGANKMFAPVPGLCYGFNFKAALRPSKDNATNSSPLTTLYGGREFGLQLIVDIEG